MKAATVAPAVKELFEAGDTSKATRYIFWISDDLQDAEDDGDVERVREVTDDEPIVTGLPLFDAAVAALAERHCAALGLPIPKWATQPSRYIEPTNPRGSLRMMHETHPTLAEHGVIIMEQSLETKRHWSRRIELERSGGVEGVDL
jgi:hypothetical protein